MPVLDLSASSPGSPGLQNALLPLPLPLAQPGQAHDGEAAGVVRLAFGELIAIDGAGSTVVLADGDAVVPGDVLITRGGGRLAIDLPGGASLSMGADARVEVRAAEEGQAHLVAHSGAFVVAAGSHAGGVTIETGAAVLMVGAGALAFRYGLETGLSAAAVPGAEPPLARIVNGSGVHVLDADAPALAIAEWSEPPEPMSAPLADEPDWLQLQPAVEEEAGAADPPAAAEGDGSSPDAPPLDAAAQADAPDGGLAFETGAGTAEDGDATFVFASPSADPRGLADLAPAAAPLPTFAAEPASPRPAPRPVPSASGHEVDALYLWQPTAAEAQLPPPPPAPVQQGPQLRGWEPSGRIWDVAGDASACRADREYTQDGPQDEIRPTEGGSMAALKAAMAPRRELEHFLGLQDGELNDFLPGAIAHNGAAMRTSVALKAGQTLVFDVLFDAVEPVNSNDFAAFTVARDGVGEGFVLSSIAATGDFGVSPWQTLRYTAGVSGTFTIGFAVVNDTSADGPSRLYVDAMRTMLGPSDLHIVAEQSDAFGGRFQLYSPEPGETASGPRLISGFETPMEGADRIGQVKTAGQLAEPDGCRTVYTPTEGTGMAVLQAQFGMRPALEAFLGLQKAPGALTALPVDADGTLGSFGAATKLTVAVASGDRVSFDWMFDAGGQLPDNDFAVFTVVGDSGSRVFKLADVRMTGEAGASGWRTSIYTATEDEELTLGFAVVNDGAASQPDDPSNSRLLIDNVWLNHDIGGGYQLADLPEPGALATLPVG